MQKNKNLVLFGKRIQAIRFDKKITQEQLAELTGLDRTYISSVECGKRNISILNIIKIAESLNISASSLLENLGGNNE